MMPMPCARGHHSWRGGVPCAGNGASILPWGFYRLDVAAHLKPGSLSRSTPPPFRTSRLPSRVAAHAMRIAARRICPTRSGGRDPGERVWVATPTVAALSIDSGLTGSRFREAAAEISTAGNELRITATGFRITTVGFRITTIKLRITRS